MRFSKSFRGRIILLMAGLTLGSIVTIAVLSITSILSTGEQAKEAGSATLRSQIQNFLTDHVQASADRLDFELDQVKGDVRVLMDHTAALIDYELNAHSESWRYVDHFVRESNGIMHASDTAPTGAFLAAGIQNSGRLEREFAIYPKFARVADPLFETDPKTISAWYISAQEFILLVPNAPLWASVDEHFVPTRDFEYADAAPELNPDLEIIWTSIYDDAAGAGTMVSSMGPVIGSNGDFFGVAGVDITLESLTSQIENSASVEEGYSFLLSEEGRILALPDVGFRDVVGRDRSPDEFGTVITDSLTTFKNVVRGMLNQQTGFNVVDGGVDSVLVAYAPIPSTGWSIAHVVDQRLMMQVVDDLQSDLDRSTSALIWFRIFPVGLLLLGFVIALGIWITRRMFEPIEQLVVTADGLTRGEWDQNFPNAKDDEIGVLSVSFQKMTTQLRGVMEGLEEKVAERTKELEEMRVEADRANEAKSAFLANMSHELRTPMNAIIGYTEMLQEEAEDLDEDDDFFSDDLKKIHAAGKHLLSLINDVLDLSKIESGKMELYNETFELAPLMEDIASTIHSLIEKNSNELKIELDDDAGEMHADITKIRQSIFNLLSNAAKFTKQGTITLSVDRSTEEGVDWISFAVADTGIGVAADKLDKLFEEFSQADESTTRQYGGTGLGLAITKRFCEMMGGSIGVTSELGVGTTFTIRLPAVVESKKEDQVAASQEAVKTELGDVEAGATVLVIDDDETARELLQRTLERDGYQVVLAVDGEEGLERARQIKPAVITLDVMMPKMDGWAVLKALKEDEALRDIPVIMVTIVSDKEMMFALGAVEHLTKPVDREALRSLIEKYMATDANRALIIEDDEPSRSMLRRTLEELDWDVAEAENGKEGLELLDQERPDLILLDLMMPVMDGFEFVEEVRRREDLHSIPIIVVSAKDLTAKDRERLHGAVEIILEKSEQTTEQLLRQINDITK